MSTYSCIGWNLKYIYIKVFIIIFSIFYSNCFSFMDEYEKIEIDIKCKYNQDDCTKLFNIKKI